MTYEELDWQVTEEHPGRKELQDLLSRSSCPNEFVRTWIRKAASSVRICTGIDDDEQHTLVCIIPLLETEELLHLYYSLQCFKTNFPNARPISTYITGERSEGGCSVLDEEALDKRAIELGLRENYDLYSLFGTFEDAFEYLLSYAIDNIADCSVSLRSNEELFDDCPPEDQSLLDRPIGCCHMHYSNPESGVGFGEYCHFYLDSGLANQQAFVKDAGRASCQGKQT